MENIMDMDILNIIMVINILDNGKMDFIIIKGNIYGNII